MKKEKSASTVREYLGHTLALTFSLMVVVGLSEYLATFVNLKDETLSGVLKSLSRLLPAIGVGFSVVSLLVSVFVFALQLKVRKASSVKYSVAQAFMKALDDSSFNPHRFKKDPHEQQLNAKTV